MPTGYDKKRGTKQKKRKGMLILLHFPWQTQQLNMLLCTHMLHSSLKNLLS